MNNQGKDIKTFVFFDTETTGLPSQEHNRTRIVELCLAAVQAEHICLGVFPRILPKISLCFNPRKFIHPGATEASGLTNELLEAQPEFNADAARLLCDFLNMQRKPLCFVAHNGNSFDYPILRAELHKIGKDLPEDVLCVDSLIAFRQLYKEDIENQEQMILNASNIPIELQDGYDELLCSVLDDLKNTVDDVAPAKKCNQKPTIEEIQKRNETTPRKQIISSTMSGHSSNIRKQLPFGRSISFKLVDVYKLLTKKIPTDAHQAEYDVFMLIECVAKLEQRFIDWANLNALKFCDIPMMQPGRAIKM